MPLNDEQKKFALDTRDSGASENRIAKMLGVKVGMVRMFFVHNDCSHLAVEPRPVMTDRERADWEAWKRAVPRDLTAALMGDPLPGRSALERR